MGDGGVAIVHLQQRQFMIMKDSFSATTNDEVAGSKTEVVRKKKVVKVRKVRVVKRKKKVENVEVEEGELGTLKLPSDDLENGEILPEKPDIDTKGRVEESEKGEFVPDRRWKSEVVRDSLGHGKVRRYDSVDREWTPPSGKYDAFRRNEFSRSGNQLGKSSSRWDSGYDRRFVEEECGFSRAHEYSNGKDYNRLKRYTVDSDNGDRKHHGEYVDYASSKSRRLSHESRHTSSSSRVSSADKYSSRHYDSSFSSRVVYDRRGHSPGRSEWSPHDRARSHDHRGDRSPVYRDSSPYSRGKSPYARERFSYDRGRYHDHRNRSPSYTERSPYNRRRSPFERGRCSDYKNRSPTYAEQSPQDRGRYRRDHTPKDLERSPPSLTRANGIKETNGRSGATEKSNFQCYNRRKEKKVDQKDVSDMGPSELATGSLDKSSSDDIKKIGEKDADSDSSKEKQPRSQNPDCRESPCVDGSLPEELASMEEDMDICDTPPHDTVVTNSSAGNWYYLDHLGVDCGPSKLCELKALVEEGVLMSDHMIKHLDSDRWVTVENASSPLIAVNFSTIASDSITQLATPPEAPGNLLIENGEAGVCAAQKNEETFGTLGTLYLDGIAADTEILDDLHIDERVGALLEGFSVTPGKELEILGEALQTMFEQAHWDRFLHSQEIFWNPTQSVELHDKKADVLLGFSDLRSTEAAASGLHMLPESSDSGSGWHSSRWSCKGGDWKRNDDIAVDRSSRKKLVLNDGFPLCQMPKSGREDPRLQREDELYHSESQKLNLPPWAFFSTDEKNDLIRSTQSKTSIVRGVKGTMMPVVRINACVVKDHGLSVSEPRIKARGRDRYSSRSVHSSIGTNDAKRSSVEGDSRSYSVTEQIPRDSCKSITSIDTPKDRLSAVNELHLPFGDWYYLDGAGHDQGPFSFSELQKLVDQSVIQNHGSVYRKSDKVWVPVTSVLEASAGAANSQSRRSIGSFHSLYPQFIGYTRWKLHELVMKSYKSREFAAAINDVLDPWINAKQPKKEVQSHGFQTSYGSDTHAFKRARLLINEDGEDDEMDEDVKSILQAEYGFEDLCGDTNFYKEESISSGAQTGSWGLLDGCLLARIFHCLRSDLKSLVFASLTCKYWRTVTWFYKDISKQVDLSSIGYNCSDSTFRNIMSGYKKEKIDSLILVGCTGITPGVLEDTICAFPSLSSINISGCGQFSEVVTKFQNINWFNSRGLVRADIPEQLHFKVKSLKQITDKTSSLPATKGCADDFGELKEYFDSVAKRDSNSQFFGRSLYKRSKLFDARKSSSILSRDARMRRWTIKKSENGYKKVEQFLASSLKEIMKVNTFDIFVSKVAKIEDKMKNGYYISHGLNSVKEDISRICRDALKAKNRGNAKDITHIITLFIQLASRLEEISKTSYKRDEMMRSWEDDAPAGFGTTASKYKNKLKSRRYPVRSNDCASDREIKRRLSKLNRKSMESESGTSEHSDGSSEYNKSYSQSTASDTGSDLDLGLKGQIGESRGNGHLLEDEYLLDTDDREWGARMTKASLVPPVTRKYEVIDQYVIVADEEDVQRKMRLSLPDDHAEKLDAQRNGTEESDMELPEVKDFKPRKLLGYEVIEQEVYGIDPYTHNLLLDSMSEDLDWSLLDKHVFIEDLLLCTLNKQVRRFTGSGSTPMTYPLQPVVEEIERNAAKDHDMRTLRVCMSILKAMNSRPDDKYVAYRKGLGVVCNKEGGFGEQDFVVEFLGEVYPAWKWFEKQDGIRSLQKNKGDPAPEFYNIYLERPKGDAGGYDLVVVDAMHKANYASRICHSCRPNCEAKVTAVNGHYQIGVYSVRTIQCGEEITFDYNSVTESKEEYEASVCLCGSQVCRGSYLNLTGEDAFQKVLAEWHGVLDRVQLMLEACELNSVAEEDYIDLGRAGLGSCLLGGLPDWLIAYSARLVRFINFERTKLPKEILRHNLEEKRKYFSEICPDVEESDAEVQAEGVYNQRLQNLAVTLDKVRYVMRCVFGDPKDAPPPMEKLSPEAAVSFVWTGEGSLVGDLLQSMGNHIDEDMLNDLKSRIHAHDPLRSDNILKGLRRSLLWLRDELRNLPCTNKCRHDAAADLLHIYAYTKFFFRIREYKPITSSPVYISPLDLGPKSADQLGGGLHEYCKQYGENYCLGQLIFWHNQSNSEPDNSLMKASRGCLSLPDISSFYAKKPQRHCVYGPKTVKLMLSRMEKQPQRPWPKDQIWSFKSSPKVFGSPMLDAVVSNSTLDREMVNWLKNRPAVFQAMWDR